MERKQSSRPVPLMSVFASVAIGIITFTSAGAAHLFAHAKNTFFLADSIFARLLLRPRRPRQFMTKIRSPEAAQPSGSLSLIVSLYTLAHRSCFYANIRAKREKFSQIRIPRFSESRAAFRFCLPTAQSNSSICEIF